MYKDKDYKKEVDFVEGVLKKYSKFSVKKILDAGCGTGGHAIPLAKRGYEVVGFDSSTSMIKKAREKAKATNANVKFCVADLRDFQLNERFDACISMFAVMGYLPTNQDVQKALANIRKHLKRGSLFIFDCWNGLAVLRILPSVRVKNVENEKIRIIRTAEPDLDAFNHLCKVNYRLIVMKNNKVIDEINETHTVRFFFPQEIIHYLEEAGFKVLKICPFLDLGGKVNEETWNMTIVARLMREK